jgi:WD40 repeat protein
MSGGDAIYRTKRFNSVTAGAVAVARDGRRLAQWTRVGGGVQKTADYGFEIVDGPTGELVYRRDNAHTHEITAMRFTPDGKYLATASFDRTIKVWELESGREVARIVENAPVLAVGFSGDGRMLAAATDTGDAAVYLWRPADLIAQACRHLTRNLLRTEWDLYLPGREYRPTCPQLPIDQRPR